MTQGRELSSKNSEPGKVIAFYSFKGGTGRSMALANVACMLAAKPTYDSVLMIDWDLEAPGLHRYFKKQLFSAFRGVEEAHDKFPGLIDLFIELQGALNEWDASTPQDFESAAALLRELPLDDYIIQTDIPNLKLLKAGEFNREYAARVGAFDWMDLYRRSPFLLRALAEKFAEQFNYILIDSRTGLTDTSGICAMLMPEVLVTVFTPNQQSLCGVIDLIQEAARYRSESDDIRPLIVYPLPSRIEAAEPVLRKQWRFGDSEAGIEGFQGAFERAFKESYALPACNLGPYFDDVQIQHVPRYAYGEEVAVLVEETQDRFSLTRSYQRFARRLQAAELPWTYSKRDEDPSSDEGIPVKVDDDRIRERTAATYLATLKEFQTTSKSKALRLRAVHIVLNLAVLFAFVWLSYFASLPSYVGLISLMTASVAFFLIYRLKLIDKATSLDHVAHAVDLEVNAFEGHAPPYDTDVALQRLRSRVDILQSHSPARTTERKKIYISYRRRDDQGHAGRLYDSLKSHSNFEVTMDIDSIKSGEDFVRALEKTVSSADVVLAVIGPGWLDSQDTAGERRLDHPSDFVRLELASALRKNQFVIPVLVRGASMPREETLPPDISDLARRNAFELSDRRWEVDILRLNDSIEHLLSFRS